MSSEAEPDEKKLNRGASFAAHYETLGVPPTATYAEARAAFKKLALAYHPDKNKADGAQAKFVAVSQAFEALTADEPRRDAALFDDSTFAEEFARELFRHFFRFRAAGMRPGAAAGRRARQRGRQRSSQQPAAQTAFFFDGGNLYANDLNGAAAGAGAADADADGDDDYDGDDGTFDGDDDDDYDDDDDEFVDDDELFDDDDDDDYYDDDYADDFADTLFGERIDDYELVGDEADVRLSLSIQGRLVVVTWDVDLPRGRNVIEVSGSKNMAGYSIYPIPTPQHTELRLPPILGGGKMYVRLSTSVPGAGRTVLSGIYMINVPAEVYRRHALHLKNSRTKKQSELNHAKARAKLPTAEELAEQQKKREETARIKKLQEDTYDRILAERAAASAARAAKKAAKKEAEKNAASGGAAPAAKSDADAAAAAAAAAATPQAAGRAPVTALKTKAQAAAESSKKEQAKTKAQQKKEEKQKKAQEAAEAAAREREDERRRFEEAEADRIAALRFSETAAPPAQPAAAAAAAVAPAAAGAAKKGGAPAPLRAKKSAAPVQNQDQIRREREALEERRRRAAESEALAAAKEERKRLQREEAEAKRKAAADLVEQQKLQRQREAAAKRQAAVEAEAREHEIKQAALKNQLREKAKQVALVTLASQGQHAPPPYAPQPRAPRAASPVPVAVPPSDMRSERTNLLQQQTRDLHAARTAAQQAQRFGDQAAREALQELPEQYLPKELTPAGIDAVLAVVQQNQAELVPQVTVLQQLVEQLSEMSARNEPIVYLQPHNTPIEISVIRQQCEVTAQQLRESAMMLQASSNIVAQLQRAKQALQLLDGSSVAALQAQQAVDLAELSLQLEQEYVTAVHLAAQETAAKQRDIDAQARAQYDRDYAAWQKSQETFTAKLEAQIAVELKKLVMESTLSGAAAVAGGARIGPAGVPARPSDPAVPKPEVARQPWRRGETAPVASPPVHDIVSLEDVPAMAVAECPLCQKKFFMVELDAHTNICLDRVHGVVPDALVGVSDEDLYQEAIRLSLNDLVGPSQRAESDGPLEVLADMFPSVPPHAIRLTLQQVNGDFDQAVATLQNIQNDPSLLQKVKAMGKPRQDAKKRH